MSVPEPNPLNREVEDALDGIRLQDLDEAGRMPSDRKSAGERMMRGTVVGVSGDDVIVELGPRMQGVIKLTEFEEPPAVGAQYDFTLRGQEDGLWILSRKEARALAAWSELAVGDDVKAVVTGVNSGGLELKVGPLSAFMPASHVALHRVEDLEAFVGQSFPCQVLEVDAGKKRVLLSRREVLKREREEARAETLGGLASGQVMTGKVTRVEAFGAFVDLGGIEGLLHVSNVSRSRVEDLAEHLKPGQEVRVMVLEIKDGGQRIGLGMKQLEPDPWDDIETHLAPDTILSGKVVRLMEFGAFVEVLPGIEGLLHVSQMGKERVRRPQDVLKVGEEVSVRVLEIDKSRERISLSRMDARGAVIGSEDAVDGEVIQEVIERSQGEKPLGTNLGNLFKKALGGDAQ